MEVETVGFQITVEYKDLIKRSFSEWLNQIEVSLIRAENLLETTSMPKSSASAGKILLSRMGLNVVVDDFVDCIVSNFGGSIPEILVGGNVFSHVDNVLVSEMEPLILCVIAYAFCPVITFDDDFEDGTAVVGKNHERYAPYHLYVLKLYVKTKFTKKYHDVETDALFHVFQYIKKLGVVLKSKTTLRLTFDEETKKPNFSFDPVDRPSEGQSDVKMIYEGGFKDDRNSHNEGFFCTAFWTFFVENLNFCEPIARYDYSSKHKRTKWMYTVRNCLYSIKRQRNFFFETEREKRTVDKEEEESTSDQEKSGRTEDETTSWITDLKKEEFEEMSPFSRRSLKWLIASQTVPMMTTCCQFWTVPKKIENLGRVLNHLCFQFWKQFDDMWESSFVSFNRQRNRETTDVFLRYVDVSDFWKEAKKSDSHEEVKDRTKDLQSQKRLYEWEQSAKTDVNFWWETTRRELGDFDIAKLFKFKKKLIVTLRLTLDVSVGLDEGTSSFQTLIASTSEINANSTYLVEVEMETIRYDNENEEEKEEEEEGYKTQPSSQEREDIYKGGYDEWYHGKQ